MTTTYKTNLVTSRNANLAEQHDLRERLNQLESEETQLKGAIAVLTQIDQAEAEKAKADAEARAAQETLTLPPAAERQKATGQTVRSEWEFEVVNPFDVFRSNPGLCKIEIRASEVKAVIASQLSAGITPPKIPGLRVFEVTKVSVRQTPAGKVVDV